ncbi:MAG: serine--tRNA ligase [candidate division Zixibacteria bacterium HGW-Zixibacteria-1]|nr:MAG: serine--tRNA ligase [candidate division Zixibacteria bacterium HGW-Zixibacteria-1]
MLDLKFIRENPELVKQAVINKNESADIGKILELDEKRRDVIGEVEKLKALRNTVSEQIAAKKRNKEDAAGDIARMKEVGQDIAVLDNDLRSVMEALDYHMLRVPNVPHESVPIGPDEASNVTVSEWGEINKFSFKPLPHWELGEKLDLLDLPAATKIVGSGFYVLKGAGARLQRALISFMLDTHTADGFTEIAPPFIANAESMTGTGQLPKLADDMYQLKDENFYLIPTGEVPVTNLHRDEILTEEQLPLYYACYTPCFRREAGAAGKDTRGTLRVHQFDKVEMVKIVHPDRSAEEHETLLKQAEKILRLLKIPYRVRLLATGDLSFAAAKCYDIEIWAAGVEKYLEISSVSNFMDFQARRMNTRFRNKDKKVQFVHTLNGSGVALARLVPAILENYQTEYGSIVVPEALRPYMGGLAEITSRG